MASTYSGTLSAPASTGSASFTGFGFTPKFVILTCTNQTTANTDGTHAYYAQSFITAATQIALGHSSENGLSGDQLIVGTYSANAMYLKSYTGSTIISASLVSLDADGITLNFATTSSGVKIGCFAIGGSGVTDAYIKEVTPKGSTGTQASTGVGFQADFMFSMGHAYASATEATSYMGFGFCDASLNQACFAGFSDSGSVDNTGVWYSDKFHATTQSGLSIEQAAAVTAIGADGFTLNYTTSTSTQGKIYVACIKTSSGSAKVGTFTDRSSSGTTSITGASFTPNACLFLENLTQDPNSPALANYTMLGACGESVSTGIVFSQSSWGIKGSTATRVFNTNKVIRRSVAGGIGYEASLSSYNADGVTLNYSTASASPKTRGYMLLNIPADAPVPTLKPRLSLLGVG